ncbi:MULTISPECIES: nucleotide sugar dehydrogenase [unclassified Meridianimarinicoccus]|uniref:nucleotide sugar dehydrogenase n=1 Tax=unclassified Meridianimarinicoccus TaxID=2923344 RepID=UPI001869165B|nr:nucleotide sugar dehydrogenase [Fluviibacterium sp. MJW13]
MNTEFSLSSTLKDKIKSDQAHVAVIGLGYVGLPLALTVHEAGFRVTGVDLNSDRVAAINAGQRVITYLAEDRIATAVASGRFGASDDFAAIRAADIILICVPTPLDSAGDPDLAYVRKAGASLSAHLQPGQLVVLESTVWPGATQTVLRPLLEDSGLSAGKDFFLGFSPEREDPGNEVHHTNTIPKIVGGDDPATRDLLKTFYEKVVSQAVPVDSCAIAEAVKLVENTFRTVNIAYVNEMKVALDQMGIDIWDVIPAAATKPFGYMPFYPGPGIGGDCIPVSPVFLSWRARDVGSSLPLVDLARSYTDTTPATIAQRIIADVSVKAGVAAAQARVLLLGVSYKKDIEDSRVSPAIAILRHLEAAGVTVDYHDPYFPVMPLTRDDPDLAGRQSIDLSAGALAGYDAVLVTTDHTHVDYALVAEHARLVFDSRNVFDGRGIVIDRGKFTKV